MTKETPTLTDLFAELPADSPLWSARMPADYGEGMDGDTLAHVAGFNGQLPAGFSLMEMTNDLGETVADHIAIGGLIPDGFDWSVLAPNGLTAAHVGAIYGTLPDDFDQWDLKSRDGVTVAEMEAHARSPERRLHAAS